MEKYALIVMGSSDTPEGRGRMVHAMTAARELVDAGEDVKLLFEGIGVTWLTAFDQREHPFTQNYGGLFDSLKEHIHGACHFCTTGRFDAGDAVKALDIPLLGEEGGHYSFGSLVKEGFQIITF